MAQHIALLGDSVFDNDTWARPEPEVLTCLREYLPSDWTASLHARDGSTLVNVGGQTARLPRETTHVVASMGGNDLLTLPMVMPRYTATTVELLAWLTKQAHRFEDLYRRTLAELISLHLDLTVCTIYGAGLPGEKGEYMRVLLSVFDDIIIRVATENAVRVIELRSVCTEPADFTNAIEPSGAGGRKIAHVIAETLGAVRSSRLVVGQLVRAPRLR